MKRRLTMATPLSLLLVLGAFAGHVRAEVAGYPSLLFISPTAAPLGGARASSWASSRPHLIIAAFHGLDHKGLGGTFALSGACHPSARRRTGPTVMMAASKKDYYAVLGVDRKADKQEIKRAFKRLAMRNHPDVSKDPDAKNKFIEINEAYAILSDVDQRRKYDLGSANPFAGYNWGSTSSSSSSSSSRSYRGGSGVGTGEGFDFDAYWKKARGSDESLKDIDDSFSKIFDDLFTGVKKARQGAESRRGGSDDSLLDDFGDFLETILGTDELGGVDSSETYDQLDEEAMRLELRDAELVVEQLKQRMERLRDDAAKAEALADQWARKAERVSEAEDRAAFMQKQKSMKGSAERLRQRSKEVQGHVSRQIARLDKIRHKLESRGGAGSKTPSTPRPSSSTASTGAAQKVVISCTACGQKVRVPAGVVGTVACPACGVSFRTGGGGSSAGSDAGSVGAEVRSRATAEKVVVQCPSCSQGLRVPKGQAGSVDCPSCMKAFRVDQSGKVEGTASSGDKPWAQRREAGDGAEWADELRMKEELRRARVEDDLSKLKKDLGKM